MKNRYKNWHRRLKKEKKNTLNPYKSPLKFLAKCRLLFLFYYSSNWHLQFFLLIQNSATFTRMDPSNYYAMVKKRNDYKNIKKYSVRINLFCLFVVALFSASTSGQDWRFWKAFFFYIYNGTLFLTWNSRTIKSFC